MNLKKTVSMGATLLLTGTLAFAQTKPFGAGDGMNYGLQPDVAQDQMNTDVETFYDRWTGAENGIELVSEAKPAGDGYLSVYENTNMYIVKGDAEGSEPDEWADENPGNPLVAVATSEGTGYGMIITALMAGYDANAQMYFDGLMNTYLNNLSGTTIDYKQLNTMSWVVPDSLTNRDGSEYARTTSSTDGDLDIAYALLMASIQWETPSSYADTNKSYMELAKALIQDIHDYLISDTTHRVLMGDWQYGTGDNDKFNQSVTRPSDWMISHFRAFDRVLPSPKWQAAIDEIYRILPMVDVHQEGLVPDFVEDISGYPSPVRIVNGYFLEDENDDKYDNNSCRVPWRMALDYIHNGGSEPKNYLERVNDWAAGLPQRKIRDDWSTGSDATWATDPDGHHMSEFPESVNLGYYLDGVSILQRDFGAGWEEQQPWLDFHFVSPIGFAPVAGDNDASVAKLNTTWALVTDQYSFGGDNTANGYTCYFGDSITLMEMLIMSGNWWEPIVEVLVDEWTPGIFYKPGDEVMYEGNIYVCTYYDVASKPGREPDQPWMWAVWSLK